MHFDTRAEPARFHEQLREEIVQVHLRVYRRQRVLPGRGSIWKNVPWRSSSPSVSPDAHNTPPEPTVELNC
jgi:hypothetical protein